MIPTAYFRWVRSYDKDFTVSASDLNSFNVVLQQWWHVLMPSEDDGGFSAGEWITVEITAATDAPPNVNKHGEL